MDEKMKQEMMELVKLVGETWTGAAISAGVTAGFFNYLKKDRPTTAPKMAQDLGFDVEKVKKWLFFAVKTGFVQNSPEGYLLTSKGGFLAQDSFAKDLFGMYQLSDFYMTAATHSKETFKTGKSMEALSEGKISRDYQPKVSDNLSSELVQHFEEFSVQPTDSFLDIGSGNGSFLRNLHSKYPDLLLTGLDSNLFAIELGRKENIRLGLTHRIKLLVGDAGSDLNEFQAESYDWVTAINLFHFIPVERRFQLALDMVNIARKGVMMTEAIVEASPIVNAANPLMSLLWNDFTGFFKTEEADTMNAELANQFKKYKITKVPILQGSSYLVVIQKN